MKKRMLFEIDGDSVSINLEKDAKIKNDEIYKVTVCALGALLENMHIDNEEDILEFLMVLKGDVQSTIKAKKANDHNKKQELLS